MPKPDSQQFLRELDKKLWTAADSRSAAQTGEANLRLNQDAAVYSRAERDKSPGSGTRRVDAGADINLAGLIDLLATIPFQHADPMSGGVRTAPSDSPRQANRSSPLPNTFTRDQHPDLRANFVTAQRGSAFTPAKPHSRSSQWDDKSALQHQGMVGRQDGGRRALEPEPSGVSVACQTLQKPRQIRHATKSQGSCFLEIAAFLVTSKRY